MRKLLRKRIFIGFIITSIISLLSAIFSLRNSSDERYFFDIENCAKNKILRNEQLKKTIEIIKVQVIENVGKSQLGMTTDGLNYLKKYPFYQACKTYYNNRSDKSHQNARLASDYDYSKPANKSTHNLRIVRALIVYYPTDRIKYYENELKWLYRSWINIQKYEPAKWRTDLIIFIKYEEDYFKDGSFFLHELNCSFYNKRKSPKNPPMCTLIKYIPVNERNLTTLKYFESDMQRYSYIQRNINIFDDKSDEDKNIFYSLLTKNLANYAYVDSILMAFEGYEYFKEAGYNFLIRSDMDVFLTPLFAQWLPRYCDDFCVGGGGYASSFNVKRLKRVANNLGFNYANRRNMGSTWYSTPEQFRIVSYLTLFSMAYLAFEEFAPPERESKIGTLLWPDWHYGVLLLYGQDLALNHLIGSNQINLVKLDNLIDFPSGNEESVFGRLHIHVFHGEDLFSKFMYSMGKYDTLQVKDEDLHKVKFYALKMALDAKRTSSLDLYRLLVAETIYKN